MTDIDAVIEDLKGRAECRINTNYPEGFRQDALRLVDGLRQAGWTQKRLSSEIDVPWVALRRWRSKRSPRARSETSGKSDSFRSVAIFEKAAAGEAKTESIAFVSPSDWLIEGLTVAEAVEAPWRPGLIGTNRKVCVWAYPKPCDPRKGHYRLSGFVNQEFEPDLLSGDYFFSSTAAGIFARSSFGTVPAWRSTTNVSKRAVCPTVA